jgi:hypothetical protein
MPTSLHIDSLNTIEGRHLVLIYATVFLIQGGYFLYVAINWFKLRKRL